MSKSLKTIVAAAAVLFGTACAYAGPDAANKVVERLTGGPDAAEQAVERFTGVAHSMSTTKPTANGGVMTPAEFTARVQKTNPDGIKTYADKVVDVQRMYNPATKHFDLRWVKVAGTQATAIVDGKAGIKVGQAVHVATMLVPGGAGRLYIEEAK